MSETSVYRNPVLPGFYPDPSACRVGDDFYLVNSSFAYFPGIPVSHSRDLVHWRQIGNALDRPSQLPLAGAGVSRGLFAPTIRHDGERFYITCTNVDHGGNFVVTARDPAGPWSEPEWLEGAPGIDPSLFFDSQTEGGDGRTWFCGTRPAPEGERYGGNWEIWLAEFDPDRLRLVGEPHGIWRGALRDCIWPEGPHLYRKDGWLYLTIAEGGTGPGHAVAVARARGIEGPWEGDPANPILTNRHLGKDAPIVNVGHGDLVRDARGDWWMLHLASRPYGGSFTNLGRETFLVPVDWVDDWPVPSPGAGKVEEAYPCPRLPRFDPEPIPACDNFEDAQLAPSWLSLRGPAEAFSSLSARPGYLRLAAGSATLRDKATVSYVCRRQTDRSFAVRTALEFSPSRSGSAAGIALFQSEDYHYRLEVVASGDTRSVRVVAAAGGPDIVVAERPLSGEPRTWGRVVLAADARGQDLSFRFGPRPSSLELLAAGADGRILSPERAGGFVGTTVGMFASGNGRASPDFADFDWFEYRALD